MSDTHDGAIEATEDAQQEKGDGKPFDVRLVIGGLFTAYGVLVLAAGVVDGSSATKKTHGIDINIWSGISMLLLGVGFLIWMRLNPVEAPPARSDDDS